MSEPSFAPTIAATLAPEKVMSKQRRRAPGCRLLSSILVRPDSGPGKRLRPARKVSGSHRRRLSQATVQSCIVHLLRHSLEFASYKDRKAVAAALKDIFRAINSASGEAALAAFEASPWGRKYPAIGQSWRRAWPRDEIDKQICTGVLFMMRASDLVTKRGVSAASAAGRPIRSLPD